MRSHRCAHGNETVVKGAAGGLKTWSGVRLRGFAVVPNVFANALGQVGDGREDAAREQIALDLREPQFDLVQPRRIGRREVQPHLRMIDPRDRYQRLFAFTGSLGRHR